MPKYKLLIAYDGTSYGGWQTQPNSISIQSLLEKALETTLRCWIPLIGSGRTDAGVHALGQVAHFSFEAPLDKEKLLRSLNGLLPLDVRLLDLHLVHPDFHAQKSAISKVYHYHILNRRVSDPFTRLYSWHIDYPLDWEAIQKASCYFVGTHDFTSFASEAHQGAAAKNPIRTLKRLECFVDEKGSIRFELEADGFLYKMVRNIVGTLIDVGSKRFTPDTILEILNAKDRKKAGVAAPSRGLFLTHVHYPKMLETPDLL